jgi:hypothetical protein
MREKSEKWLGILGKGFEGRRRGTGRIREKSEKWLGILGKGFEF